MLTKKHIFYFFIWFSLLCTAQQNFLETSSIINDLVYNSKTNEIIYANDNAIYFVDYETLKLKDSIQLITNNIKYIQSIEYLDTPQPLLVVQTRTNQKYYTNYNEYPNDSIYYYSIRQQKIVNKFSGNIQASFNIKNPNIAVVGLNKYRDYKDTQGYVSKTPLGSNLQSLPEQKTAISEGAVRNIQVSNDGQKVAITYYKYFGKDDPNDHYLEIRSLPDLEILATKKIKDRTNKIHFSQNDDYVVLLKDANSRFSKFSLSEENYIKVYDVTSLAEQTKIQNTIYVNGVLENGAVWKKVDSEIIHEDYSSKKQLQRVWSNLTPFSIIDGFVKVNDEVLLLYGNKGYGFSNEKNGIYKFTLKGEAIYSEVKKVSEIDTLYNPSIARIMNNKVAVNEVQYNVNKNLLLIKDSPNYDLNSLQLWSALEKKKLYDIEFPLKINPFLDRNGESCLIFEEYQGQGYSGDFILKTLDISTGITKAKVYTETSFNAFNSKCYNLDESKSKWICNDGSAKFWGIDTEDLSYTLITELSNSEYYRTDTEIFRAIPNSDDILIAQNSVNVAPNHSVTDSRFEGYKIFNPKYGTTTTINLKSKTTDVFPVDTKQFIVKTDNNINLYNIDNQTSEFIYTTEPNTAISKIHLLDDEVDIQLKKIDRYADSIHIINYNTLNKTINQDYKIPSSDGVYKTFEGINYYKYQDAFYTYDINNNASVRWYNQKPIYTQPTDIDITEGGKLLYSGEWLINLENLEVENKLLSFTNNALLNNNKILLLDGVGKNYDSKNHKFKIVSSINQDSVFWESNILKIDYNKRPNAQIYSKDKNFILFYNTSFISAKTQSIFLVDIRKRKVISRKINYPIGKAIFSETTNQIVIVPNLLSDEKDEVSRFYNLTNLKLTKTLQSKFDDAIDASTIIFTDYDFLVKSNITGETINDEKTYYARETLSTSKYIASKNIIVAGSNYGKLFFWDLDNSSPKHIQNISDSEIIALKKVNNLLYVLSKESQISIVNLDTFTLEVNLNFFEKEKDLSLVWLTPEGFFKANKVDLRNFHFVKEGKVLPVVDYEIFLNRPDVIMEKLGFAKPDYFGLYKKAYLKRLARNGYTEDSDIFNTARPKLELNNRTKIPILLKERELKLDIENTSNASELFVYINGVPVNTESIKDMPRLTKTIKLNAGINRISILSKNEKGIESEPISFEVKCLAKQKESKIYYVGIGVSDYEDASMNLKYADIDVQRLSKVFADRYKSKLIIDTLLNKSATKDAIKQLKIKLEQTDVDDTIIISFSGHGLISKDDEFYFATHDIDFNLPEVKGISYNEIHDLLTNIPARKKLLLLDACHSGELDNTSFSENKNNKVVEHVPEGAKGSIAVSSASKNEDTFNLMQSLFFDTNRGNGAYVISAAGGAEFAYESKDWKNGVFTYSFINALYYLRYNENGISISQLKKYVYDKVKTLTNNKQRPTSRAENLEWDWLLE